MLTAMLAARNLTQGEKNNVWEINGEQEYHENIHAGERKKRGISQVLTSELSGVFSRMDPIAFGISVGIVSALIIALATLFLIIKGGPIVGPNLQLLFIFMPGYHVNLAGILLGLLYGLIDGFIIGSIVAYLRNLIIYLNVKLLYRDIELKTVRRFLDYM